MNTKLYYIGANGNQIDFFDNTFVQLVNVDGLTGVSADISASTTPSMDGDRVNNVQAQPRGIVLDLLVKDTASVEDAKRFVLQAIKPKQRGRLRMIQPDRSIEIVGIVESIEMPRFSQSVMMQVSLYCSQPFWSDIEAVIVQIARVLDLHCFPLDVGGLAFPAAGVPLGEYDLNMTRTYTNDGDAACGMIISIIALGDVLNPTIYKSDGSFIGVNDSMTAGDEIVISTVHGEKSITKNGVNILNKIKSGSTFLQLDTGDNELTINSDGNTEGNVYFLLSFKRRFV